MTQQGALVKRKVGRPIQPVPEEFAREIVAWLAAGKSLREYCQQPGRPHFGTVYDRIAKDQDFAQRVAAAREVGFDQIALECLAIADEIPADSVEVQHQRLRIDTRLRLLAKWCPRRFGDRVGLDHTGGVAIRVITGVPGLDA